MIRYCLLSLLTLSIFALGACGGSDAEESENPPAETAPPPADPVVGGELNVDYWFIGMEDETVTLSNAFAYPDDDRLRIELVGAGINADCNHNWRLGRDLSEGQLAVAIDTHGLGYDAPFNGQPGTVEHVGYTYYYYSPTFERGTNSGNSARADADTSLTLSRLDEQVVVGSVRIRDQIRGNFVARVCN